VPTRGDGPLGWMAVAWNSMAPRCLPALTALLLLLPFAACGEDQEDGRNSIEETSTTRESTGQSRKDVVATVVVEETEYKIDPSDPRVAGTGTVAFEVTNAGKTGHALGVEGSDGEVETEEIAPGDTATLTADLSKPGRYSWYCPVADHEQRGMTGSILVGDEGTDHPREEGEKGPGSDGHGGY